MTDLISGPASQPDPPPKGIEKPRARLRTRMAISFIVTTLVIVLSLEALASGAVLFVLTRTPVLGYITLNYADQAARNYALQAAVQGGGERLHTGTTFEPGAPATLNNPEDTGNERGDFSWFHAAVPYIAPGSSPPSNRPTFALVIRPDSQVLTSSYPDHIPVGSRIEQEMSSASFIQHSLLPEALPEIPGWQVEAFYRPAREVGGDLYDFLFLPGGRTGIVIGDATGKGIPSALIMATTTAMIRAAAPGAECPGEVLELVNNPLQEHIPAGTFATCFFAILDPAGGQLRYANAGHNIPYLCRDGAIIELSPVN